ncbi:MAG TPA: hypothetical protein VEV65_12890, partial [Kineosporiaceae bacterium]|nr:hypothetical protein [Kineosporiaceae bacterium]
MSWQDWADRAARPIRVEGGLVARSERGAIGSTWWSKRFIAVLESLSLGGRLSRGRTYARKGQVLELDVRPGAVTSTVQGSRPEPYAVRIRFAPLPDSAWQAVERALGEQALYRARLLAGELPGELEQLFAEVGAPLFPRESRELAMRCSCPDIAVPCKHLAATFYLLAERFDDDPFELLLWRGRSRADLLADLGADAAWIGPNEVRVDSSGITKTALNPDLCREIRASFLLAGPLLARFGRALVPPPGGDVIGRRRLDTH